MGRRVTITVDDTWRRWMRASDEFGEVTPGMVAEWQQIVDVFFDRSQDAVHVVTGALKASGHAESSAEGTQIVGTVEYGGNGVDYAIAELMRGGTHDYLSTAYEKTSQQFRKGLVSILNRAVYEAYGGG
jgi:hypothetical protein